MALCGAQAFVGAAPSRGRSPLRGERPFLFLRKKKRSFTPKKKRGPVYGGFGVDYGGFRLYALFGDQPRPLRPCHWGTGKSRWFYLAAAWLCHSRGRVRRCARGVAPYQVSRSAARDAPDHPGPERGTRRRRADRAQTVSILKRQAVTAGRDPQCHTKAASRRFLPPTYRRPGPLFSLG